LRFELDMKLALFDLDHTLIPFDSGMAWTRFLVRVGALDGAAQARYLAYCQEYVAGTLDIHAMHHASMAPLAAFAPEQLRSWQAEFEREMAALLPASMLALVASHRDRGDLCAIVTATSRLVAEPFARGFGVAHLLATEAVRVAGVPTGAIDGLPCYREHKLTRVQTWLAVPSAPQRDLEGFESSWFYSDSAGDLPLLEAVSHPVAVRPDPRLRAHANAAGWRIIDAI
jgi:HAD superfamily hydrolase (TIGR01490 family)